MLNKKLQDDVAYKLNKFMKKIMINGSLDLSEMHSLELQGNIKQVISPTFDSMSIQNIVGKNTSKGINASFASTTNRFKSRSDVPGPGSYDIHPDMTFHKNKFDSFGTTSERKIDFNRSIHLPFTNPSYMQNPPVGIYQKNKRQNKVKSNSPHKSKDRRR